MRRSLGVTRSVKIHRRKRTRHINESDVPIVRWRQSVAQRLFARGTGRENSMTDISNSLESGNSPDKGPNKEVGVAQSLTAVQLDWLSSTSS